MAVSGLTLIASFEGGDMYIGSHTHGVLVSCIEYGSDLWGLNNHTYNSFINQIAYYLIFMGKYCL